MVIFHIYLVIKELPLLTNIAVSTDENKVLYSNLHKKQSTE